MKKDSVRGQINISFGMIFSVILIVVFLAFAFYAIKTFINFENSAKAGKFLDTLQSDITRVWTSEFGSQREDYTVVPSYANYICFVDFSSSERGENSGFFTELKTLTYTGSQNFAFYPIVINGFQSKELNNINLGNITSLENPFCIKVIEGKVSLILKKGSGEKLVRIERP